MDRMQNNVEITLPARMVHQSTRYLLGRNSSAVTEHVEWLISNWFHLPAGQRFLVETDVEAAFDQLRTNPNALGHPDLNKPSWVRLRSLWSVGD